jgi:hypothetical protein
MAAVTEADGLKIYDEVWTSLRPHSCVVSPSTLKIFDGRKLFFQCNTTVEICIFHHQLSGQYELVCYDPKKRVELDRLYLSEVSLLNVMQADLITRKMICNEEVKDTIIAEFIMIRLSYNAAKIRYIPRPGSILVIYEASYELSCANHLLL